MDSQSSEIFDDENEFDQELNNDDDVDENATGNTQDEVTKRSEWWKYFDVVFDENEEKWVKCKHCDGG